MKTITLRPIDNTNVWDIAELDVREDQQGLVMTSQTGLMEAYAIEKSGGWVMPLGIYDGETPVGFVLFTYGAAPGEWHPEIARGNYEINHFYIDRRYQGRGYGRAGLEAVLSLIRTQPAGPAPLVWIAYKPGNVPAERLYTSLGFVPTDMRNYEEIIAVQPL